MQDISYQAAMGLAVATFAVFVIACGIMTVVCELRERSERERAMTRMYNRIDRGEA